MTLIEAATRVIERVPLPDGLTAAGIRLLVDRTRRRLSAADAASAQAFAAMMARHPIAVHPDAANAQHYEVPEAFFGLVLGPRRKYSCCLYPGPDASLAEAEAHALGATADHAALADGQDILELGCGWGSLSLWMAERYPNARIVAVSNSHSQRAFIEAEAARSGLVNLRVITADMNAFDIHHSFDRVVSVEMFEHMTNWQALLGRIHGWLRPEGRLFLHVFSHRTAPYQFDPNDRDDWIARHFFTGGIMPSHGLIREVAERFAVEAEWRWDGTHYARTARDWLSRFDAAGPALDAVLHRTYGTEAGLWRRRWRLFFLATAGLFGHAGGSEWGVSHYRLARRAE